jgi:hypothetical protein
LAESDSPEGLSDWRVVGYNLLFDTSVAKMKSRKKFSMVRLLLDGGDAEETVGHKLIKTPSKSSRKIARLYLPWAVMAFLVNKTTKQF